MTYYYDVYILFICISGKAAVSQNLLLKFVILDLGKLIEPNLKHVYF